MYVQVKLMGTDRSEVIKSYEMSRTMLVENFKKEVEKMFHVEPTRQRLFFGGKEMEEQYTLFDYSINRNDVIQLMVRETISEKTREKNLVVTKAKEESPIPSCSNATSVMSNDIFLESKYFSIGDYVDVKDYDYGSWFTGKLKNIKKDISLLDNPNDTLEDDGLIYVVEYQGYPHELPVEVPLRQIRPLSLDIITPDKLKAGDKVLMNFNVDYPKERGCWYDVLIKNVESSRKGHKIIADVFIGSDNTLLANCQMMFYNEIYTVKPYKLLKCRTPLENALIKTPPTVLRAGPLKCIKCKDKMEKPCMECGCKICGGKENDDKQLLCDECDCPYHITCLTPPLTEIPEEDDWYCPLCKTNENEIVKAGGKLKLSKKKTSASSSKSKRDWGKGMACVGRTKKCRIVSEDHFGPIPGIEVGTTWLFRIQVSEAGVHRPPVGGIHGRDKDGAFSIVLSGGYEDDIDNGNEFIYTGSGGRDLTGNKRTAGQSSDQQLTHFNRALARNCDAKVDDIKGATATNWKKGKPVRVVRNYKLKKHSEYAPDLGNRYDGLYKVVKYYSETGQSGFKVWRFLLRRDDPTPPPWTKKGKMHIVKHNLELIYPENYVPKDPKSKLLNSKKKRILQDAKIEENAQFENKISKGKENDYNDENPKKKVKVQYELEKEIEKLIALDSANIKYWDDCKESLKNGKKAFLDRVEETFLCICCQELVFEPITTLCSHNVCKGCLKRSFNAEVFQCPACRAELGKKYSMDINSKLYDTLVYLFPGYNADRS